MTQKKVASLHVMFNHKREHWFFHNYTGPLWLALLLADELSRVATTPPDDPFPHESSSDQTYLGKPAKSIIYGQDNV